MTGKGVGEEGVFLPGAPSDVMDDEGCSVGGPLVADDHDMGKMRGDGAGDEVSGFVVVRLLRDREAKSAALEKFFEVGDAAVVNILVGALEPPDFGISGKVRLHVPVDQNLQVEAVFAQGADHHIRANSAIFRDVAAGVFESHVGAIVGRGHADPVPGGGDDGAGLVGEGGEREDEEKQDEVAHLPTSVAREGACLGKHRHAVGVCEILDKHLILVDLTDPEVGFPVVQVIIPGYSDVLPFQPSDGPGLFRRGSRDEGLGAYPPPAGAVRSGAMLRAIIVAAATIIARGCCPAGWGWMAPS